MAGRLKTKIEHNVDGTKTVSVDVIPDVVFPEITRTHEAKYALLADSSKPYIWISFGWLGEDGDVFTRKPDMPEDVALSREEARRVWNNLMDDGFFVATSC